MSGEPGPIYCTGVSILSSFVFAFPEKTSKVKCKHVIKNEKIMYLLQPATDMLIMKGFLSSFMHM